MNLAVVRPRPRRASIPRPALWAGHPRAGAALRPCVASIGRGRPATATSLTPIRVGRPGTPKRRGRSVAGIAPGLTGAGRRGAPLPPPRPDDDRRRLGPRALAARVAGIVAGSTGRPTAHGPDRGMSTAEYAIGTVTACAFAAVLYVILTGSEVSDTLTRMVTDALQGAG